MEDKPKVVDSVDIPDFVVEESDNVPEEADEEPRRRSSHAKSLPVEKAIRRVRSKYSENERDQNYLPVLDGVSLHTTPSMFSLVSMLGDIIPYKEVRTEVNCYFQCS